MNNFIAFLIVNSKFCTTFAAESQRNSISLTYLDIIHHGMLPGDTATTNLPERFRGVPLYWTFTKAE
jgi:hypothetical protein